jgi:hypothetical protein
MGEWSQSSGPPKRNENMERQIAAVLNKQLGNVALAMLGARDLVILDRGLRFRVGRNPRKVAKVEIELAGDDTYTVRTITGRPESYRLNPRTGEFETRGGYAVGEEIEGVYVDALHETLRACTGLDVRL